LEGKILIVDKSIKIEVKLGLEKKRGREDLKNNKKTENKRYKREKTGTD